MSTVQPNSLFNNHIHHHQLLLLSGYSFYHATQGTGIESHNNRC